MKKIFLLFTFVALFVQCSFSQIVPIETARAVAKNIYFERATIDGKVDLQNISFAQDFTVSDDQQPVYYVFNVSNNRGFVIVSAEERSMPVLFYTFEGSYTPGNQPENFNYWLRGFEQQIVTARAINIPKDKKVSDSWAYYSAPTVPLIKSPTKSVSQLLTTTWDQEPYYNALCPSNCPTGCVATAMAQVMKYHKYPTHGYSSHSYATTSYGTLSANFGAATYNWASMPNNVNSSNSAVATLMYHCGVSVNMDYSPSGSGAYIMDAASALSKYFIYNAQYAARASYSDADWTLLIKTSLDTNCPVLYGGVDATNGGHAFVCDGYQNSGTYSDMFHFNWGWSGSSNGYILLNSISPSGTPETFSQDQEIVYKIYPKPATLPVANFTANSTSVVPNYLVIFTNTSTNNPLDYLWSITPNTGITYSSGTTATTKNTYVRFANVGYYTVSLTSTNSAGSNTATKTDYIHVWINDAGIQQVDLLPDINIYPNPTDGLVTIETDNPLQGDVSYKIYDIIGNEILGSSYTSTVNNSGIVLNLSECRKGLYFIKVTTSKGSVTKKIELTK